jgi:hypothetical protein
MRFDVSRDFLDGVMLQHPQSSAEQNNNEVQANASMQFLPSSPDGTMHTAVVSLRVSLKDQEQPFAHGGWRFLFTSDEEFDPKNAGQHPYLQRLLINGASKILAVLNPLCLHGNMPLIPLDTTSLVQGIRQQQQEGGGEAKAKTDN